jgi:hypothetical protein
VGLTYHAMSCRMPILLGVLVNLPVCKLQPVRLVLSVLVLCCRLYAALTAGCLCPVDGVVLLM